MLSYTTLTVLALAASTAFSAPVRVTRERVPTHPELISVKRDLLGVGAAKIAEEAAPLLGENTVAKAGKNAAPLVGENAVETVGKNPAAQVGGNAVKPGGKKRPLWLWGGPKFTKFLIGAGVGGTSFISGTEIYHDINPNSKFFGGSRKSASTSSTTKATTGGTAAGYPSATGPGYTNTGYGQGTTGPSTDGDDIFSRSNSDLNSRTSKNLLSGTDLENAITLFTRMLDELD